jgi:rhodanese-related sulfurtransferase
VLRFLLLIFISFNFLFAKVTHLEVNRDILSKKDLVIVDIRTKEEWYQTGILTNSKPITFFDMYGRYDIPLFLSELNKVTNNGKKDFAIICRSGNRTTQISSFLAGQGYDFYNLKGGISLAKRLGIELVPYEENK